MMLATTTMMPLPPLHRPVGRAAAAAQTAALTASNKKPSAPLIAATPAPSTASTPATTPPATVPPPLPSPLATLAAAARVESAHDGGNSLLLLSSSASDAGSASGPTHIELLKRSWDATTGPGSPSLPASATRRAGAAATNDAGPATVVTTSFARPSPLQSASGTFARVQEPPSLVNASRLQPLSHGSESVVRPTAHGADGAVRPTYANAVGDARTSNGGPVLLQGLHVNGHSGPAHYDVPVVYARPTPTYGPRFSQQEYPPTFYYTLNYPAMATPQPHYTHPSPTAYSHQAAWQSPSGDVPGPWHAAPVPPLHGADSTFVHPITFKSEYDMTSDGPGSTGAFDKDTVKRRKSHRSIEQKRRDHINSGIDELAKLIPGPQRSKGKTVHRAAAYLKHVEECQERFNEQVRKAYQGYHTHVGVLKTHLQRVSNELAALTKTAVAPEITELIEASSVLPLAPLSSLQMRESFPADNGNDTSDHDQDGDLQGAIIGCSPAEANPDGHVSTTDAAASDHGVCSG